MKKLLARLRSRGGYTLVELIVTCALLGMFAVVMVNVIFSSMNLYRSAAGHAHAQTVSQTLLEKITGEITGAQPGAKNQYGVTIMDRSKIVGAESDFLSYETGACIALCSRTGSQIYLTTVDGRLLVHYRPVNDNDRRLAAVDWTFDDAVYSGFVIDSLTFSIVELDGATTNVIRIALEIHSEETGYAYSSERFAQCYNFTDAASVNKITYDGVKMDGVE